MDDLQYAGFPIFSEKEGKATRWRLMEGFRFDIPEPFTLAVRLDFKQHSNNVKGGTDYR